MIRRVNLRESACCNGNEKSVKDIRSLLALSFSLFLEVGYSCGGVRVSAGNIRRRNAKIIDIARVTYHCPGI